MGNIANSALYDIGHYAVSFLTFGAYVRRCEFLRIITSNCLLTNNTFVSQCGPK